MVLVRLIINGDEYKIDVPPWERLVRTLSIRLGYTSVREGCGRGECGTCMVIVNGKLAPSCLLLTSRLDGAEIVTLEGLSKNGELHYIQKAFYDVNAFQCGYCAPGVILTAYWLLEYNSEKLKNLSEEELENVIKKHLSAVLCRCGSYHRFVKAVKQAYKLRQK